MASLCSPPSPSWWLPLKGPEVGTKDWSGIEPTFPFQSRLAGTPTCRYHLHSRDQTPGGFTAMEPACSIALL